MAGPWAEVRGQRGNREPEALPAQNCARLVVTFSMHANTALIFTSTKLYFADQLLFIYKKKQKTMLHVLNYCSNLCGPRNL